MHGARASSQRVPSNLPLRLRDQVRMASEIFLSVFFYLTMFRGRRRKLAIGSFASVGRVNFQIGIRCFAAHRTWVRRERNDHYAPRRALGLEVN